MAKHTSEMTRDELAAEVERLNLEVTDSMAMLERGAHDMRRGRATFTWLASIGVIALVLSFTTLTYCA